MKRIHIYSLGLLIMVVLIGVGSWWLSRRNSKPPFRIAIVTWIGHGPFYVAQDKGFYREEGLSVEILKIEDSGARHAAFVSGKVDGAINTVDTLASGIPHGIPGITVFEIDESYGADGVVARGDIKEIKDLRGKTVAYPRGLPSHFFFLYLLKQAGLSSKDIKSATMEAPDAGAAFIAGKVDAAVTWEPWLTQAKQSPGARVLITTREAPGLIADIFMISRRTRDRRSQDVRRFMRGWFKAIEYVKTHPQEASEIMARRLGVPPSEISGMLEGIRFPDYQANLKFFGLEPGAPHTFSEMFREAGLIWQQEGVIDNPAPADQAVDVSFLQDLWQ